MAELGRWSNACPEKQREDVGMCFLQTRETNNSEENEGSNSQFD